MTSKAHGDSSGLSRGAGVLKLSGFEGVVNPRFGSDGWRLRSASIDRTIRVWDATPLPNLPAGKRRKKCLTILTLVF
jgi:WD40 repeat protein